MKKKWRKIVKIILVIVGGVILVGGIFWLGMYLGKKDKNNSDSSKNDTLDDNSEIKKELEEKLSQVKNQLDRETDSEKKKKLENEKKDLEQKIKNLGGSNNNQNPPQGKSRQITIKYNTEVGGKHEYINVNNNKERVLIDTKNKIFQTGGLTDQNGQYTISFNEEEAGKHKNGDWLFDENNDKFQLKSTTTSPPGNQNSNNNDPDRKIELEVKWNGGATGKFSDNNYGFIDSNWPNPRRQFAISKNHPIFKGKKLGHMLVPNCKISFLVKDASDSSINGNEEEWFFNENNQKFTLIPLGNWPDDGSNQGPNQTPPPRNNNPPPTKQKVTWQLEYTGNGNDTTDYFFKNKTSGGLEDLVIIKQANPALHGFRLISGNRCKFSFWTEDPSKQFTHQIFSENDKIEISHN